MESKFSEEVQKLLDRYRELYNEWQDQINDKQNLSDECLLTIALDEAIAYRHLMLDRSKQDRKE